MNFPFSLPPSPHYGGALPQKVDVTIIGGGIIGIMTAWFLAERGMKVLVCEKGRIAAEQSSRNWGWIRQQGRDPAELPIAMEAGRIWKEIQPELGESIGLTTSGVAYLGQTEADLADYEAFMLLAKDHGLDSRILTGAQAQGLISGYQGKLLGALHTPSDQRAEPWVAVPLMAAGAARRGVILREQCAVRTLDLVGGRVAGVVTEQGPVACDQVLVAAGAWSRLFLANCGVKIPQLSVLSSVAETGPLPDVYHGAAIEKGFALRRRADGGYSLAPGSGQDFFLGPHALASSRIYLPLLRSDPGAVSLHPMAPNGYPDAWGVQRRWTGENETPFERMRILNPKPNVKRLDRMAEAFGKALPALGKPKLRTIWAGMIDTMPDIIPVIDRVAAIEGLVIATGMSGHGFGIGPGFGRVIADLIAGQPLGHDLRPFRLSRYSDGTKISASSPI